MKITLETSLANLKKWDALVLIHGDAACPVAALPAAMREEFNTFCKDVDGKRASEPRSFLLREEKLRIRLHMASMRFLKGTPQAEAAKCIAASVLQNARKQGEKRIAIMIPDDPASDWAGWLAEGFEIGGYQFLRYRSGDAGRVADPEIVLVLGDSRQKKEVRAGIESSQALARSVNAAREIINLPGSELVPEDFARHARRIAKESNLIIEVLDEKDLKKSGYAGLLHVGRGSAHAPRMVILRHLPAKAPKGKRLCLIGKGITFDTGGLNIKTGAGFGMWTMKSDMGGAGAVLHAMESIACRQVPLEVVAIMGLAENVVDAHSVLPGDIFKARNGKTVQIENTDAEGRLTLTDALYRAGEEKATHIVDIATLTGACVRALGTSLSGLFCNNKDLAHKLVDAGSASGEELWQLPMVEEYREMLKTPAADLNNIGSSPNGGAITAALFLSEFVPEGAAWAHIDIAGPSFNEKKWRYLEPGASGVMVRTLVRLAEIL